MGFSTTKTVAPNHKSLSNETLKKNMSHWAVRFGHPGIGFLWGGTGWWVVMRGVDGPNGAIRKVVTIIL